MKVPNEILLDVLHPLDYSSLLRLNLTASRFYHAIERNTASIATLTKVSLWIYYQRIRMEADDNVIFEMEYDSPDSFEVALDEAAVVATLHPIVSVEIWCKAIESGLAESIFSYLPAAYARHVSPFCISQTQLKKAQLEAFIVRFPWLKSADLDCIPIDFDWSILRSEHLLRLPDVYISPATDTVGKVHLTEKATEEITRFCSDVSKNGSERPRFLELWREWDFSQAFVERIIQVIGTSPSQFTLDIRVELADIGSEEKQVPGYDGHVFVPRLELDGDRFVHCLFMVNHAFPDGRRWADVAYHSRHSRISVFVLCRERVYPDLPDTATILITNDPAQTIVNFTRL